MSRALVLSGSIGMGHDVVAEACASALAGAGWEADIVDCMDMLGRASSRAGRGIMRTLMAVPGVYDAFHFSQLRTGSPVARLLDRAAARQLVGPLAELLSRRPAELLLSVFATGAAAADRLKAAQPWLHSVVYCTDACPHALWTHPGTDLFLVTSDMSAAFISYHRPDATVTVLPAAARPAFYSPPTRAEARAALGVPAGSGCAVVMAGAWGMAPLERIAVALADSGLHVLAVAGTNRALAARLEMVAGGRPDITAFGFTDRIPELMAAADLVVTTPGDTCTEARLVGRPLLLLDTVPGHGRENLQLELARGGASVVAVKPALIAEAAKGIIEAGRHQVASVERPDPGAWARSLLDALATVGVSPADDAEVMG
ncbi:MAG TPA: hypothetical protein VE990_10460 [Acidimicrobiales bacterium]|nr:hypothetical protein [Acidimicrobiales bacterium]